MHGLVDEPWKNDEAKDRVQLLNPAPDELIPMLGAVPVALRESVGGKEDKDLYAEVAEEGKQPLDRHDWIGHGLRQQPEPCRIEVEFVFANGIANYVEIVVKHDCGDRNRLHDQRIATIKASQHWIRLFKYFR